LAYFVRVGCSSGPAIILEAVDLSLPQQWAKSLSPENVAELERLRADGHRIITTKRRHIIHSDLAAARTTQLYRTLPHEIGHWLDYLDTVEVPARKELDSWGRLWDRYFQRPSSEREAAAHGYADYMGSWLRTGGQIPFERLFDPEQMRRDGLRPLDFSHPAEKLRTSV
jgi:hypothetical protein